MPVACFQAVGESLSTQTHSGGMWMGGENGRRIFRSWGGFLCYAYYLLVIRVLVINREANPSFQN